MFVSRKNLPLIHFVPAEVATGANVTEALHQSFVGLSFAVLGGELEKPLAEQGIEGFVLRMATERACSMRCSSALRVIFFTDIVYTKIV